MTQLLCAFHLGFNIPGLDVVADPYSLVQSSAKSLIASNIITRRIRLSPSALWMPDGYTRPC
ncbi:hypothetical protein BDV93DRAFT_523126 [Ceratobasidium sp. AG-I]|nr:hypothetical protein BDV93DRAFT_523126 [Ceratobasidium sp. AG-I]